MQLNGAYMKDIVAAGKANNRENIGVFNKGLFVHEEKCVNKEDDK